MAGALFAVHLTSGLKTSVYRERYMQGSEGIQKADINASLLMVNELSQNTKRGLIPLFASDTCCACSN